MKVAFLHARQDPKYANLMLESVRKWMPNVDCLQLTDNDTPALNGCIVIRRDWVHDNPMIFKMSHLNQLTGDILVLDTDVIVQKCMRDVFKFDFDMALTWRDGPIYDPDGLDLTKIMPYNCGVMFQRSPEFWTECLRWCRGRKVGWYADQLAVAAIAPHFDILKLHCDNFNYTPKSADEDLSTRHAVHYKGTKRHLMDKRFGL